jgi:hypothetical protein
VGRQAAICARASFSPQTVPGGAAVPAEVFNASTFGEGAGYGLEDVLARWRKYFTRAGLEGAHQRAPGCHSPDEAWNKVDWSPWLVWACITAPGDGCAEVRRPGDTPESWRGLDRAQRGKQWHEYITRPVLQPSSIRTSWHFGRPEVVTLQWPVVSVYEQWLLARSVATSRSCRDAPRKTG